MKQKLTLSSGGIYVIKGQPGSGKTTFLNYAMNACVDRGMACTRIKVLGDMESEYPYSTFSRILLAILGNNFYDDYLALPEDHQMGANYKESSRIGSRKRSSSSSRTTSQVSASSAQGNEGDTFNMGRGKFRRRASLSSVTEESSKSRDDMRTGSDGKAQAPLRRPQENYFEA